MCIYIYIYIYTHIYIIHTYIYIYIHTYIHIHRLVLINHKLPEFGPKKKRHLGRDTECGATAVASHSRACVAGFNFHSEVSHAETLFRKMSGWLPLSLQGFHPSQAGLGPRGVKARDMAVSTLLVTTASTETLNGTLLCISVC